MIINHRQKFLLRFNYRLVIWGINKRLQEEISSSSFIFFFVFFCCNNSSNDEKKRERDDDAKLPLITK